MILNLKELSNVVSQISDLVAGDKTVPGILFNIKDNLINVCYTDGNKVFSETITAETTEEDKKGKIVFNYQALTRIIEACKPTGKIITDTVEFIFGDNRVIKIRAEKKIPVISRSADGGEETSTDKLVSVTEQSINWVEADASRKDIKIKVLERGNYELNHHYSQAEIDEMYKDDPEEKKPRPFTTERWQEESDSWDVNELRAILSKLSIEAGKLIHIAPTSKKAFVKNTSCVLCLPIKSNISHKIVQSTSIAKALSTVLGKIDIEDGYIHTHMIDSDTVVYSTEDNLVAISLKNLRQDNGAIAQVNNCLSSDFSKYILTFNREVLQSCLYGAKTASASEKVQISFEPFTEIIDDNGTEITKVKLLLSAKNTNSSTDNKYDVIADYVLNVDNSIANLKINATLEILYQAVSKSETDYIALDINVDDKGGKMVRVAEIDMDRRSQINEEYGITGGWTPEFMMEHRGDMLGYTTYFAVTD